MTEVFSDCIDRKETGGKERSKEENECCNLEQTSLRKASRSAASLSSWRWASANLTSFPRGSPLPQI